MDNKISMDEEYYDVVLEGDDISIRSKERVNQLGEVFTPTHIVKDMMDMSAILEEGYNIRSRWLEPACGNGQFLVEMVARKVEGARRESVDSTESLDKDKFDLNTFIAMTNIYGIDIMADNVTSSRNRMMDVCKTKYEEITGEKMNGKLSKSIRKVVDTNIILGDTLANKAFKAVKTKGPNGTIWVKDENAESIPIIMSDWQVDESTGMVHRVYCPFNDLDHEDRDYYEPMHFMDIGKQKDIEYGSELWV